jgi:hypothetical protein
MSLNAKQPEQKEFEKVPEGSHIARCIKIIDLGTQVTEWAGVEKLTPKAVIVWEIPGERIQYTNKDGKEVEAPMTISSKYTVSLAPKANIRAVLESWRGKAFTQEELDGFNISKVLGVPCMLSIVHEPSKDGTKIYANVSSVMKLPKGIECPPQENPSIIYDIDAHDQAIFDSLPKYYQEQINQSQERLVNVSAAEKVFMVDDEEQIHPETIPF